MLALSPVNLDCLQSLIRREFEVQKLEDVYCPACKKRGLAQKKSKIVSLEDNLVFHLARLGFGDGYLGKSTHSVNCPFQLDASKVIGKNFSHLYELVAFITHIGGALSGHYICYRKFKDDWYALSDENVKKIDGLPSTSQAYILLYTKK
jgi:ubiquitin C-terminal hydrolase